MKKYNQELTVNDVLHLFKKKDTISKFEICDTYNVSLYRVNATLEEMDLKITNYGFKLN